MRIACIGECMIELSEGENGAIRQDFAGDTANLAVYLARLLPAPTARVSYVTALGDDEFSAAMIESWQREGIDTALVRRLPKRLPGLYWITTGDTGERSFHYWRSRSAARAMFTGGFAERLGSALAGFRLICLSGITLAILSRRYRTQLIDLLKELHDGGSRIVFDSNYRLRLWSSPAEARETCAALFEVAQTALVSYDDEQQLHDDDSPEMTCNRIHALGAEEVVVRRGAEPCLVSAPGERLHVAAPLTGTPVDTTAAGDSFDAGYLAARSQGQDPGTAALAGHRLAARVVEHPGALLPASATPTLAELLD